MLQAVIETATSALRERRSATELLERRRSVSWFVTYSRAEKNYVRTYPNRKKNGKGREKKAHMLEMQGKMCALLSHQKDNGKICLNWVFD